MTTAAPPLKCYHCGNDCATDSITTNDKHFCCHGCQTVYTLLADNNLCAYYDLEKQAGVAPTTKRFEWLDTPEITHNILDFQSDNVAKVTFFVPAIHCISCLYLLENLHQINAGIGQTRVDFLKKQVAVTFNPTVVSLRQVAELMTSVGYEPLIDQNHAAHQDQTPTDRKLLTQLGVAGFCAGNIMLFSFPEYLGLSDSVYQHLFGYLNLVLATPVVFYAGSGYFESVYRSLKRGKLNLDVPILLSVLVAFFRGVYEVVALGGAGYFDSVAGLIFFLLIGKWFQQRTYAFLSFERDYKSYFPMAATRLTPTLEEEIIPIEHLKKGDRIVLKDGDIVPADALLYRGEAQIDYSFVTGESALEAKRVGDLLYAGGRQVGQRMEAEVVKDVSQSYLTQLWNNDIFQKNQTSRLNTFSEAVGRYFTVGVLTLAFGVAFYWYTVDPSKALNAFTSVLIIACPCTLALSYPFALGNGLRILGKQQFYLKNTELIEALAQCDTLVFDKTGTLTNTKGTLPQFVGAVALTAYQTQLVAALVQSSAHPISRQIGRLYAHVSQLGINNFKRTDGQGIAACCDGQTVRLGAGTWLGASYVPPLPRGGSGAFLEINGQLLGYFEVPNSYRTDVEKMFQTLGKEYQMYVLSGDNDAEKLHLSQWFDPKAMRFGCSPHDKLDFVQQLQNHGHKVVMLGDGLNDAGALKQADVGIAIAEDTLQFTPSSDAILAASQLVQLPKFLKYSRFALRLIRFSYAFSLFYNCVGLTFALQGTLSPVVAAVLMPLNSITLVAIASLGMVWRGKY
ncbi:MAG: HAD family hydrolase [Runella slithyformis]|nr:MAG: HAD family hydrolase [Runella slithyformis]